MTPKQKKEEKEFVLYSLTSFRSSVKSGLMPTQIWNSVTANTEAIFESQNVARR